jgi:CRP-like cAMP-binding protein
MGETDTKVEMLRGVPLFAGCSDRDLEQIALLCDWVRAQPGTVLTSEGHAGLEFFLVLQGTASVRVGGREVATVGPGDFFGELALLEPGVPLRHATVVAGEEMALFVFDARGFATVLDTMPVIAGRIREQGRARQAPSGS